MTGKQIRALRDAMGLTQSAFAERVGVERNTVNRWENDLLVPSRTAVLLLERLAADVVRPRRRRKRS